MDAYYKQVEEFGKNWNNKSRTIFSKKIAATDRCI